jgi:hypothetical protein
MNIKLGLNKILIYAYQISLVFGQKSTFYIGLHLCVSFNININNFKNLPTFKKYIKKLTLYLTIRFNDLYIFCFLV